MDLLPERLARDATGAPYSDRYGDVYASREGALGQARHVFLGGNGLPARWAGREQFVVLETGFGLGTNFLATWNAWRCDARRPRRLHFVSVEMHPLPAEDLLAAAPAELMPLALQLAQQWPLPLPGLHVAEFDGGCVRLTLALGDARSVVAQLSVGADAIYLDGFAPGRNPEMWEPALLRAIGRCARLDGTFATYTTAHTVRDALASAGFEVGLGLGYGRKREMLVGRYAPRWRTRRHEPPSSFAGARSAVVVGAGLAGSACGEALARRGWSVQVLDSSMQARGASALPWGLMHPQFAVDDGLLARLTRAGSAHTDAALRRTVPSDATEPRSVWELTGVFQQTGDDETSARWRRAIENLRWPTEFVKWMEPASATRLLGVPPAHGGLWWPGGLMVSPQRWVEALLGTPGIERRQAVVGGIERTVDGEWRVKGVDGATLACAPVLIVAAAADAPRLLGTSLLPVRSLPGQVSLIEARELSGLRAPLAGHGSVLRAPDGTLAVGATYETAVGTDDGLLDERAAHRSNLDRLARLLPFAVDARVIGRFAAMRCVARDRLPYAGAVADEVGAAARTQALRGAHFEDLPRRANLFSSFALGSRGLSLATLAAELIATRIEGEPWPVERSLANALDPGRVLLRHLRKRDVALSAR
jgi:tRNA 5-methylaminomethyl-2-thiouridine biosynthesis bifunctional protein